MLKRNIMTCLQGRWSDFRARGEESARPTAKWMMVCTLLTFPLWMAFCITMCPSLILLTPHAIALLTPVTRGETSSLFSLLVEFTGGSVIDSPSAEDANVKTTSDNVEWPTHILVGHMIIWEVRLGRGKQLGVTSPVCYNIDSLDKGIGLIRW